MRNRERKLVAIINKLKEAAAADRKDDLSQWLERRLIVQIGNPSITHFILDIVFGLEESNDELFSMIDADSIPGLLGESRALFEEARDKEHFFVCSEHSSTDEARLWQVKSRQMASYANVDTWAGTMDKESKDEEKHFIVFTSEL